MKPLSPLLYVKNNFKNVLPIFISMIIGVFLIYFFSLFSATTTKMLHVAAFDIMDQYNVSYVTTDGNLPDNFRNQIMSTQDVLPVHMNLPGLPYFRGGLGNTTILTFNMFEEDVPRLLDDLGLKVVEGKLPRNNQNEIAVPVEYALQNNLNVGDVIGTAISEEYALQGKYTICGLIKGNMLFSVSCQPGELSREEVAQQGIMYRLDKLGDINLKQLLKELPDNVLTLSHDYYDNAYSVTINSMNALTYVFTFVMIVVLCIALGNLNIVLYDNRRDELKILHSIGITTRKLVQKLWLENLCVCVAGYLSGVLLTIIIVCIYNNVLLYPNGKALEVIHGQGLVVALTLPVFVSIFSLIPSLLGYRHEENLLVEG